MKSVIVFFSILIAGGLHAGKKAPLSAYVQFFIETENLLIKTGKFEELKKRMHEKANYAWISFKEKKLGTLQSHADDLQKFHLERVNMFLREVERDQPDSISITIQILKFINTLRTL